MRLRGNIILEILTHIMVGAARSGFSKTLQTGGHTLNKSTLKALNLSKQQGKIAIEGLKKDMGLPANFHGKIMGNGD